MLDSVFCLLLCELAFWRVVESHSNQAGIVSVWLSLSTGQDMKSRSNTPFFQMAHLVFYGGNNNDSSTCHSLIELT
jgi:hypothetical protein